MILGKTDEISISLLFWLDFQTKRGFKSCETRFYQHLINVDFKWNLMEIIITITIIIIGRPGKLKKKLTDSLAAVQLLASRCLLQTPADILVFDQQLILIASVITAVIIHLINS